MDKFCNKCGNVTGGNKFLEERCCVCGNVLIPVPTKYIQEHEILTDKELEDRAIAIREELVKTSPKFDQYLFDNRERILREKSSGAHISFYKENGEIKARVVGSLANTSTLKCPYCGSTNISKIGTLNRAVSVGLLGLASSKIGKTHKCNKCGSTW